MSVTIHTRCGLGGTERLDAEQILKGCSDEALDLPIALDADPLEPELTTQLLALDDGRVVGIAGLQAGDPLEVCLAVHPDRRRQGIGRALLAAARAESLRRGVALLLVVDEAGAAGAAFATTLGALRDGAEHRMELAPDLIDRSRHVPADFTIRAAAPEDCGLLAMLQAESFGDPIEETWRSVEEGLRDQTRQYWVGALGGRPVGLLRIGRYHASADITAFGVLPAWRGRGIGRAMLLAAVDMLLSERHARVLIEVFIDNDRALGLYQSCGFRICSSYGYFRLKPVAASRGE